MSRDDNPENYYQDLDIPEWKEWLWFLLVVGGGGTVAVQALLGFISLLKYLQWFM